MARPAKRYQPSPLYVFVTTFLAMFLLLFTIWREPGTAYEAQAHFGTHASQAQLSARLLHPKAVLQALRATEMLRGSHPDVWDIAEEISQRLRIELSEGNGAGRIVLSTHHPQAAVQLLDALMMHEASSETIATPLVHAVQPAAVAAVHGGSVRSGQLIVLSVLSAIMGLCGVVFSKRAHACSVLLTRGDVESITRLPVITEFPRNLPLPASATRPLAHRRLSRFGLRAAELTVAAVFLLMVFRLVTENGLPRRFVSDPLAAYGEVLTEVIG